MLNLATTGKLQLITSAAVAVDVTLSWVDLASGAVTPGGTPVTISTATTTDIVAAPASGVRNVKSLYVRNKGASNQTVTVVLNNSSTQYEIRKVTLGPGDVLVYEEGALAWDVLRESSQYRNVLLADQSLAAAALTTINNSSIDCTNVKAGTILKWVLAVSKGTTAGTTADTFGVHFGTNGTSADTQRLGTGSAFTTGAQTAVADVAEVEVKAVIRSVSATGTAHGYFEMNHNLASTGFAPTACVVSQQTSAAFDLTTASLKASLSVTPSVAARTTIHQCVAERIEP